MSNKSKLRVKLYFADWCGHCKHFKPEWQKLLEEKKNKISELQTKYNCDIKFKAYKDGEHTAKIEKANIQGYPTIRVKFNKNEVDYTNRRTADNIMEFVDAMLKKSNNMPNTKHDTVEVANSPENINVMNIMGSQMGGGNEYYEKYRKYKAKYVHLKNTVSNS